ncbi:MAG: DUF1858 domain-containing protein, partial [Selenomonas sp.]|nr:DUF1858 domain-containing protein [Selenomonas sp.]
MKKIDFNLTVAELVKDNPEVRKILSALGMGKLITPEALQVMGNIMTIPRAAVIQGVALADVVQAFTDAGFAVVNGEPS